MIAPYKELGLLLLLKYIDNLWLAIKHLTSCSQFFAVVAVVFIFPQILYSRPVKNNSINYYTNHNFLGVIYLHSLILKYYLSSHSSFVLIIDYRIRVVERPP